MLRLGLVLASLGDKQAPSEPRLQDRAGVTMGKKLALNSKTAVMSHSRSQSSDIWLQLEAEALLSNEKNRVSPELSSTPSLSVTT